MSILITFAIVLLVQLSMYYWLKIDIKKLQYSNFKDDIFYDQKEKLKEEMTCQEYQYNSKEVTNETNDLLNTKSNEMMFLKRGLNHLELINKFEVYLEQKKLEKFPLELIQELEKLKLKTQTSILKTTNELKEDFSHVA